MTVNRSCTQEVILQEYISQGIKGEEDSLAAKFVSVGKKTTQVAIPRKCCLGERGTVRVNEAKGARECNKNKKREMENRWKENTYRQYVRDMTEVDL